MTDLQFIELANRFISDTQVKIKAEVGASNQQAQTLKNLIISYRNQIDSMLNPNVDKQVMSQRTHVSTCLVLSVGNNAERYSRHLPADRPPELRTSAVLEMPE